MIVQSEYQEDVRLNCWIALFAAIASIGEALNAILRSSSASAVDLCLYMIVVMLLCLYAGFKSMQRKQVLPGRSCFGLIGTTLILVPTVFLAMLESVSYAHYLMLPIMPASYFLSFLAGREFYIATLHEQNA